MVASEPSSLVWSAKYSILGATLVTVIGEAGVGKSRLAREFATSVKPAARVVTGHCPPYGDGITFWPLREILRELTNGSRLEGLTELLTDDPDPSSTAAEVAGAVGMVDQPGDPSALFGAVRRLFEAVARRKPLVIIVEDIHWAQPTLLDLLENLAASTHQPLVLLCLARPEFRERRTSWVQELDAAVTVPLAPLDPGDSERLLTSRRFGRALPPEAVTRVVETAQGNPLFLEQLLAALRDDLELRIPPTVQALLTARLDRLGPAEQDLLHCASVIGLDFSAEAVTALVAHQAIPFVDRHLKALEAKELVTPRPRPHPAVEGIPLPPRPHSAGRVRQPHPPGSLRAPRTVRGLAGTRGRRAGPGSSRSSSAGTSSRPTFTATRATR